jgi:tRNA threonylcarbamoyladenosine biosynthesis protein TsaE
MPSDPIVLRDLAATQQCGRDLAATVKAGDVIALCGTLGTGKTTLTAALVAALGSPADVTSPTFSLVHEYGGAPFPIFHFDFYRLAHPTEIINLGWDDYLDAGGLCLVEWADLHPTLLPPHAQWWHLTTAGDHRVLTRR